MPFAATWRTMRSLLKSFVVLGCLALMTACSEGPSEDETSLDEGALQQPGVTATTAYEVQLEASLASAGADAKIAALGMPLETPEERTITFFDTSTRDLFKAGTVLRAKADAAGAASIEVKRAPLNPGDVDARIVSTPGGAFEYKVDVNLGPQGPGAEGTPSCQLKSASTAFKVPTDAAQIAALFTADQQSLVKGGMPAGIMSLGPIKSKVWKFNGAPVAKKVKIEMWEMPDGSKVYEASADLKVMGPLASHQGLLDTQVPALRKWLTDRGFTVVERGAKSKTESAIEALAARPR